MATASTDFGRRGFTLKPLHIIGIGMIILAVVLGYFGLKGSIRPYTTSVNEAIQSGRAVQLAGFLGSKGEYQTDGAFTFNLKDATGKMVKVVYAQPKPANFEQAISIVAIGHYDSTKQVFLADSMLVKCPSKYQEQMNAATAGATQ